MSAYATFRVTDKKCATCRWWNGTRRIGLNNLKPMYVHADAGSFACEAVRGHQKRHTDRCTAWQLWEKLGN